MTVPDPPGFLSGRHRHRDETIERSVAVGAEDPWQLVFWSRYVGIPLLCLLVLADPLSLDNPILLAAVLILGAVPATIVVDRLRTARPNLPARLVELDSLIGAVTIVLEPRALPGVVLVMTANMSMVSAAAGRRAGERAIAISGVALFIAAFLGTSANAYLVAIYAIGGLILAIVVGNVAEGERALRRHQELLLDGIATTPCCGSSTSAATAPRASCSASRCRSKSWPTCCARLVPTVHPTAVDQPRSRRLTRASSRMLRCEHRSARSVLFAHDRPRSGCRRFCHRRR